MSDLSAHRSVVLYTYRTHTDSVLTSIPSGAISFCQESYGLPVTQSDLLKKQATCCPPLANFAQLSMFRFDGLIKNHSCFIVNNNSCIYSCFGFILLYLKGIYFYKRLVLCCKKHQGVAMERDELADDRMAFMAGEVGCVVFELIYNGIEINKDNIVGFLEGKRKAVGNVIHKGVLRDAAEMVRKGQ